MTPLSDLKLIDRTDLEYATVGDIIETLSGNDATHLLICDNADRERTITISGVIACIDIERALGRNILRGSSGVLSFAKIESTLAHARSSEINY